MAVTTNVEYIFPPAQPTSGEWRQITVRITGVASDATELTDDVWVDLSALSGPNATTPSSVAVMGLEWSVQGFNYVNVEWDHTTDDSVALLTGSGEISFEHVGGFSDPGSAGGTGDIVVSTNGAAANATFTITGTFKLKG